MRLPLLVCLFVCSTGLRHQPSKLQPQHLVRRRLPVLSELANDSDGAPSQYLEETDGTPSAAELARFALPTLGAWLVSPMMSLVDTAVIGRSATPIELAALGPATMVGDSMSYLCSFLSVATTNLVATALADGDDVRTILGSAVQLAILCGAASAVAQIAFGLPVLSRYTSARSAACVAPAYEYVRVRALGAPAALLAKVSIATSLASKDATTPLVAVVASGLLNLILDIVLVSGLGLGMAGAAWATVSSEVICAAIILRAARRRLPPIATDAPKLSLLPRPAMAATYASFARPLVLTLVGKIATYSALAHVATATGVVSTAAHRVLMCVYWFSFPFAEVCSQVGQAFLPGVRRIGPLVRKLLGLGALVGAASAASAAGVLAVAPQLFTSDGSVIAAIRALVPLVGACIVTLAPMCAMEGALLATRQLRFLSTFYTANALAMVAAFALVERLGLGLSAAWSCMLTFQLLRLLSFGLRLRVREGFETE